MNILNAIYRRLRGVPVVLTLLLVQPSPSALSQDADRRTLSFYHTHTGEELTVTFSVAGEYVAPALEEINQFLFDFRTGQKTDIDPALLDFVYDVRTSLDTDAVFEVISAYRSPETNEMLRGRGSGGVARNSQHLLGKAIDVRLRGVDTAELRDTALAMQRGGVGYYQQSDFVHLDTGRVRQW